MITLKMMSTIVAHPSSEGNGVVLKTDETGHLLFYLTTDYA